MSQPTRSAWIRRIDALLAKAASTHHAPQAETHLAKAQQLMTRYAIEDASTVGQGSGDGSP